MIDVKINKKLVSACGEMALNVGFSIDKGSFTALTGVSGSGKTTLLRCIAGLSDADSGFIRCGGEVWLDTSKKKKLPVRKRGIGFVFQDYALFPNMTLRRNIFYACNDIKKTDALIGMAELDGVADLYPEKLSSGQKQRCALLRAVSREPELLLLDEPFSALDADTKRLFHAELVKWREIFGFTVIMVSHDRAEVVRLAERVLTLKRGIIESDVTHKSGCYGKTAVINSVTRRVS